MFQTSNSILTLGNAQNALLNTWHERQTSSLKGSRVLFLAVAILALGLGGCAALPADGGEASKEKAARSVLSPLSDQGQTLADGSIRHDTNSARIAQLWSASEKARQNNNIEVADRHLRDALSIAPEDPILWSRAAEIKLTLLEPALAENYAAKSNVYAENNRTLQHRNWLIIEHAREMRGDLLGVRDAHRMVQDLQY